MVRTNHKTPAALAAVVTFLALVAGLAAVPTAQAIGGADEPLAAGRAATKFKRIVWPASPAMYGTPAYVNGKIKSKKDKKRVVILQQKLPQAAGPKVDKDKTNGKGRFHLKAKTNWYHKKLKMRVRVQPTAAPPATPPRATASA